LIGFESGDVAGWIGGERVPKEASGAVKPAPGTILRDGRCSEVRNARSGVRT